MNLGEVVRFTASSAVSHRLRSGLTALGIAIGVMAVVLLTSIGAGLRDYMLNQFTQFGTNIIAINPGKAQTFGMPAGVLNSSRPLQVSCSRSYWIAIQSPVIHSWPPGCSHASTKRLRFGLTT